MQSPLCSVFSSYHPLEHPASGLTCFLCFWAHGSIPSSGLRQGSLALPLGKHGGHVLGLPHPRTLASLPETQFWILPGGNERECEARDGLGRKGMVGYGGSPPIQQALTRNSLPLPGAGAWAGLGFPFADHWGSCRGVGVPRARQFFLWKAVSADPVEGSLRCVVRGVSRCRARPGRGLFHLFTSFDVASAVCQALSSALE